MIILIVRTGIIGEVTNPATVQAQIQGYELTCPKTHTIYDLLDYVKEPYSQTQSRGISTTQGNNRISKKSSSEGLILIL